MLRGDALVAALLGHTGKIEHIKMKRKQHCYTYNCPQSVGHSWCAEGTILARRKTRNGPIENGAMSLSIMGRSQMVLQRNMFLEAHICTRWAAISSNSGLRVVVIVLWPPGLAFPTRQENRQIPVELSVMRHLRHKESNIARTVASWYQ